MNKIKRTIYYYQISWINKEDKIVIKNKEFFDRFFKKICVKEDYDEYCVILEEYSEITTEEDGELNNDNNWTFGILSKIKKTDFPLKQDMKNGKLYSLDLKDNEGLYHPTHFAIYKGTLLIMELNYEGLRPNAFINRKINAAIDESNEIKEIKIKPILRNDLEDILKNDLREIQISIAPKKHNILKEENSLSDMFNNVESFPDLTLNFGLSMGRRRSKKYFKEFDNIKKSILSLFKKNKLNDFEKIIVKIKKDEKIESINLLDQIFKTDEEFIRVDKKNKAIKSKDAFKKFKTIYENNRVEFKDIIIIDD